MLLLPSHTFPQESHNVLLLHFHSTQTVLCVPKKRLVAHAIENDVGLFSTLFDFRVCRLACTQATAPLVTISQDADAGSINYAD